MNLKQKKKQIRNLSCFVPISGFLLITLLGLRNLFSASIVLFAGAFLALRSDCMTARVSERLALLHTSFSSPFFFVLPGFFRFVVKKNLFRAVFLHGKTFFSCLFVYFISLVCSTSRSETAQGRAGI